MSCKSCVSTTSWKDELTEARLFDSDALTAMLSNCADLHTDIYTSLNDVTVFCVYRLFFIVPSLLDCSGVCVLLFGLHFRLCASTSALLLLLVAQRLT